MDYFFFPGRRRRAHKKMRWRRRLCLRISRSSVNVYDPEGPGPPPEILLARDSRPRRRRQTMGKPTATLGDIAKSLSTSIGTVHRALHDHPGVSPATKARVLQ